MFYYISLFTQAVGIVITATAAVYIGAIYGVDMLAIVAGICVIPATVTVLLKRYSDRYDFGGF